MVDYAQDVALVFFEGLEIKISRMEDEVGVQLEDQ
jgi:hypothetical protein